jgi:cytochrome c biogenesis protein CcdA
MLTGVGAPVVGFAAGALTTLSPCVVPLLPVVVGAAASAHPRGPLALAAGVGVSFASIGVFLAVAGASLGLGGDGFRLPAACLMVALGLVLLSGHAQARLGGLLAGMQSIGGRFLARADGSGLGGQFVIGVLMGAVWSPCAGPTLGAASVLAARQTQLPLVGVTMLAFGLGAAAPLVLAGMASRRALLRWRGAAGRAGQGGKVLLGGALVMVGAMILSGADRALETAFVTHAPLWLVSSSAIL